MKEPNINSRMYSTNQTFKVSTNKPKNEKRPRTYAEHVEAKKAENKANQELLAKRERINSKVNQTKNTIESDEHLTIDEIIKLNELDARKNMSLEYSEDISTKSIWENNNK